MGECRHRAVECALIFGEAGALIGIASGPWNEDMKLWHGQAYLRNPMQPDMTPWKWLVNRGYQCEIGSQEDFKAWRFDTVKSFMEFQFGWVEEE
jgi:hypothetical protein